MKQYKQLTDGQGYQIYGLKQSGLNAQTLIALNEGEDKSTISSAVKRDGGDLCSNMRSQKQRRSVTQVGNNDVA